MKQPTQAKGVDAAKSRGPFFKKGGKQGFFRSGKADQPFFAGPGGSRGAIQTKLTVGQPNDIYEKEADAMADKVVQRMSDPGSEQVQQKSESGEASAGMVQLKCAHCEEEEKKLQKKPDAGGGAGVAAPSIESAIQSSRGSGSPLPDGTRKQMESGFGTDFSGVRIHNDQSSAQLSQQLNAQAFTTGQDIYFNSGKYNTNHTAGQHLLAHELTHVVQQDSKQSSAKGLKKSEAHAIRGSWQIATIFPDDHPPTDGNCHVYLGGRRIDHWSGIVPGMRHLYIDYYKNSTDYGVIEAGPVPPSATTGGGTSGAWVKPSTWESRGVQWELQPDDCPAFIDCLKSSTASYNSAGHTYHATHGPNSNSFAWWVLNSCGINIGYMMSSYPYLGYDYWSTHTASSATSAPSATGTVQKKCAHCAQEERIQPKPIFESEAEGDKQIRKQGKKGGSKETKEEFEQRVLTMAGQRFQSNAVNLEKWEQFIDSSFDDVALQAQVEGERTLDLYQGANERNRQPNFEAWCNTRGPNQRQVEEDVMTGSIHGACQYCHSSKDAYERDNKLLEARGFTGDDALPNPKEMLQFDAAYSEAFRTGRNTGMQIPALPFRGYSAGEVNANTKRMQTWSDQHKAIGPAAGSDGKAGSGQQPAPQTPKPASTQVSYRRSGLCGDAPPAEETPQPPVMDPAKVGPCAEVAMNAIGRIWPVLEPLGPSGYRVLPKDVFTKLYDSPPSVIRSTIKKNIAARQAGYKNQINKIASGGADYLDYCRIVDELISSTNEDVRLQVIWERVNQEMVDDIVDFLIGVFTFLSILLMFIFPPAGLLFGALAGGMMMARGAVNVSRGHRFQQGIGAGVNTPDQEASADALVVSGYMDFVMGALQVGLSAIGAKGAPEEEGLVRTGPAKSGTSGWKPRNTPAGQMWTNAKYPNVAFWRNGTMWEVTNSAGEVIAHGSITPSGYWVVIGDRPIAALPPGEVAAGKAPATDAMVPDKGPGALGGGPKPRALAPGADPVPVVPKSPSGGRLPIPKEWKIFDPRYNDEFRNELEALRGNDDLGFDRKLRGGEGQLFRGKTLGKALKRWYKSTLAKSFAESLRLMKGARALVESDPVLAADLEVAGIDKAGGDWILRDFDPDSFEILEDDLKDPEISAARARVMDRLSLKNGELAKTMRLRLKAKSINVHWSPAKGKILIIDMQ